MRENLEKRMNELEFKLKALSNFIYQHHHKVDISEDEYIDEHETSKPKVWVLYPDGYKEEPKDEWESPQLGEHAEGEK